MDTSGSVLGKIQWKNKAFEINGIVISTNLIKSKKGTSISFEKYGLEIKRLEAEDSGE